MAYIITRLCRDCIDTACVAVCPWIASIVTPARTVRRSRTSCIFTPTNVSIAAPASPPVPSRRSFLSTKRRTSGRSTF